MPFVTTLFSAILVSAPALADPLEATRETPEALAPQVYRVSPGVDLQYRLQEILIRAVPGDVIEFGSGRFKLTRQIDIATDNLTPARSRL